MAARVTVWGRWWCAVLALVGACSACVAQAERPASAERLVQEWDFEDPLADLKVMPDHWYRWFDTPASGEQARYPAFNESAFSGRHAHGGALSLMLPTSGGSTRVRLASGVIPALPGAKYMCTSAVLTEGLTHARARIVGSFLDDRLEPIYGSEASTPLTLTGGAWEPVSLTTYAPENAAWFTLMLEVVQPMEYDKRARLDAQLQASDVSGAAYFDDLRLYQVPQIRMTTTSEGNVVIAPDLPELVVRMRDLTGEALTSEIRVYDIESNEVDRVRGKIHPDGRLWAWEPELDRYGWYRAAMRVANAEGVVGQRYVDFVWSPELDPGDRQAAQRFGLVLGAMPIESLPSLHALVSSSGAGAVTLPAWGSREPPEAVTLPDPKMLREQSERDQQALAEAVEELLAEERAVTFVLAKMPRGLAREKRLDQSQVRELLARDSSEWYHELSPLLTRFGERVLRWQLGAEWGEDEYASPELAELAERIHEEFYKLVPNPTIAMPWNLHQIMPEEWVVPRSLMVRVPVGTSSSSIPAYLSHWPTGTEIRLVIDQLGERPFGVRAALMELVKRSVTSWQAGAAEIAIDQPWTQMEGEPGITMPAPSLAVWRVLVHQLAGRTPIGELRITDGARCFIAGDQREGVLIAWNETAAPARAVLRGYLGSGEMRVRDVFGNTSAVSVDERGEVEIPLSDMPVYIEGVDVELLRFRTALRLDPPLLQARAERHDVDLVVSNPWDSPLNGAFRFSQPEDWDIFPRVVPFTIAPGEETRIPISIIFALNTVAGPLDMVVEARLTSEKSYPPIELPIATEIGLDEIELNSSFRYVALDGETFDDIVVTVLVTNVSTEEMPLETFAYAEGFPSQQNTLIVQAGQSVANQFTFEDASAVLSGGVIQIGVRERQGTGRLNHRVDVP